MSLVRLGYSSTLELPNTFQEAPQLPGRSSRDSRGGTHVCSTDHRQPRQRRQTQAAPDSTGPPARFHLYSYLLGLLTALILVGGSVYLLRRAEPPPIAIQPPPSPTPIPTATLVPTPGPITVFLSGAVQQPGLFVLPPTARIGDAMAAAGGLLPAANPALVNQAERLYDGAQVHIPEQGAGPHPGPLRGPLPS